MKDISCFSMMQITIWNFISFQWQILYRWNRSTSNVIFVFLVIFRRKRPRFASFFVRQAWQKSKPRLIRSFPARLIKWRHLPPRRGLKPKVRDKSNTLDRRRNTRSHTPWTRVYVIKFLGRVVNLFPFFFLIAKRRRVSNSRLSQILLYALSAWNHRQEPTACLLNYYYYCYH